MQSATIDHPCKAWCSLPFDSRMFFRLVSLLHHIQSFTNLAKSQSRYPYLAYCSLEFTALCRPHCHIKCWFAWVSNLLKFFVILVDQLPPPKYSMDAMVHWSNTCAIQYLWCPGNGILKVLLASYSLQNWNYWVCINKKSHGTAPNPD